jgi:hypothetical protein
MEHQLRNYFDGFDMAYVTQNASERLSVSLTDRLERIQRSVSTSVIDALIRENKLDLELYENAKKGLSSRIEKIPNFNGKLAEYRKRCGQLQGQ